MSLTSFRRAPPPQLTSTSTSSNIALASFGISFASLALGAIEAYKLVYIPQAIFTLKHFPQIWRLASSMILTSPGFVQNPPSPIAH